MRWVGVNGRTGCPHRLGPKLDWWLRGRQTSSQTTKVLNLRNEEGDTPRARTDRARGRPLPRVKPPLDPGSRNHALAPYRSASALGRDGISRRVFAGSHRSCDKPNSGPPAYWLRSSACAGEKAGGEERGWRLRGPTTTLESRGAGKSRENRPQSFQNRLDSTNVEPSCPTILISPPTPTSLHLSKFKLPARPYNPHYNQKAR